MAHHTLAAQQRLNTALDAMDELLAVLATAFSPSGDIPTMSLRAGNALDDYEQPPEFDAELDRATAAYFEENHCGIAYLDAGSWRYYLPALMSYALANLRNPSSMAVHSLLSSLRPPDRVPARLDSLTPEQERAVIRFLDVLAFEEASVWKDEAIIALEEYWAPGALYRRLAAPT